MVDVAFDIAVFDDGGVSKWLIYYDRRNNVAGLGQPP